MSDTTHDLVNELEIVMEKSDFSSETRNELQAMIDRARAGRYSDLDPLAYANPKITLYRHLRECGLKKLALQVMNGEYDE